MMELSSEYLSNAPSLGHQMLPMSIHSVGFLVPVAHFLRWEILPGQVVHGNVLDS